MADTVNFDPRAISVVLLDSAKRFWGWSLALAVIGPLFGIAATLIPTPPVVAPVVLVFLAIVAELLQWRSDAIKDGAESLLRALDLQDAFGWPISAREMSDLLAQYIGFHRAFAKNAPKEPYFGSGKQPGVGRALANLEETAWWSKCLSKDLGVWCALIVAVIVLLALTALVVSVEIIRASTAARTVETLHAVGNVVTAALALVFSLGLIRLSYAYIVFGGKAAAIEDRVERQSTDGAEAERKAVMLWQDYHLARATAPFLPTWFWKMKRDKLNMIWEDRTAQHLGDKHQ